MNGAMNLPEIMGVVRTALEAASCDRPHTTRHGRGACDTYSQETCEKSRAALSAMTLTEPCGAMDGTKWNHHEHPCSNNCVDGQIERTIESVIAEIVRFLAGPKSGSLEDFCAWTDPTPAETTEEYRMYVLKLARGEIDGS